MGNDSFKYFETSKGSKYIINKNNQLRRWKSHHQNTAGEDMGLHSWSDFAMFIEPSFYDSASAFEQLSTNKGFKVGLSKDAEGKMFYMIFDGGDWRPAKWEDAYPKYVVNNSQLKDKVLSWKYTKTPTLGYHVIDVNFKSNNSTQLSSFHIGNPVSRIEETIPDEEKELFFKSDKQLQENIQRIKKVMGILKEESNKSDAEKELDMFNNIEDKVKSSHISRKKVLSWYNRMKEKYPLLKIRIQVDGDLLRAEAEIDKNRITCEGCGWSWKLSEGGDDPYTCHKCGHTNN